MIPKKVLLAAAVPLIAGALAGAGAAIAATSAPAPVAHAGYACTNLLVPGSMTVLNSPPSSCPSGQTAIVIGAPPLVVSAVFTLTDWPPDKSVTGSWEAGSIHRDVIITQQGVMPAGDCGPGSTTGCHLYTASLGDVGSFTAKAGTPVPNQSGVNAGAKIASTVTGSVSGGGFQEFYADMTPRVPSVRSYSGSNPALSADDWYKLFFPGAPGEPAGNTNFGSTGTAQPPWTTWSWNYVVPSTCEHWLDWEFNDSGQSAAAGNITGVSACTAPLTTG